MNKNDICQLRTGFETAFIDKSVNANLAYKPQFVFNDNKNGQKVLSTIEDELLHCESFSISVAFITRSGVTPFLQTFKELEKKGIRGRIMTTDYLCFSDPVALDVIHSLSNIELRMYQTEKAGNGFHTKGYIFQKDEEYRFIIGSSNMTQDALTRNMEWNTKLVSSKHGEMIGTVLEEYDKLWNEPFTLPYETFIDEYRNQYEENKLLQKMLREQRKLATDGKVTSFQSYTLKPNSMQVAFIKNLKDLICRGIDKALLISATGTGKTYASAFSMREMGYKRVLFVVHRNQIAKQARDSFKRVFGNRITTGLVSGIAGNDSDYKADFIFATVQTLSKENNLHRFSKDYFDCCIYDEAHHTSAGSYKRIMDYFSPEFTLGMTATPDKRDDNIEGRNIYEIFDHNIAYEIRLQQAMEEDLLCPFHYFGITDLAVISDEGKTKDEQLENFRFLTSDDRVRYVMEQAAYYGHSGDRVKGLIFCSRVDEAKELSKKFNQMGLRTVALCGADSEDDRADAIELLTKNVPIDEFGNIATNEDYLDYILTVDIFSEGTDIVEVNQVIMLRPTQSPIVFIQQLGRGLRKASEKEYVVILDFIGNYKNNFMIPIALSGDRTYNADNIRKYLISGNNIIPGSSTIHFDEISREKIFKSIDSIKGMKAIIREGYISLKNRLGRIPYLIDFQEQGEIDPLVIIREYKTYFQFIESVEKTTKKFTFSEQEKLTLEYLSKTILSGVRPYELDILQRLFENNEISISELISDFTCLYNNKVSISQIKEAVSVLQGHFTSNEKELKKYQNINILEAMPDHTLRRLKSYSDRLKNLEFNKQVKDIVAVGLARYYERFSNNMHEGTPFVLYEKYSRRDISLLMNCGKDLSSIMFGMKRINDDVFIFITYHKEEATDEKEYVDGKPDYADAFEDNVIFKWDSKIGMNKDSAYMKDVTTAPRKHLLVKKSDAESNFYYMGQFDILDARNSTKKDNKGKLQPITKVTMRMHDAVRNDLLMYLQSTIPSEV